MSLLRDALKRAEVLKRAQQQRPATLAGREFEEHNATELQPHAPALAGQESDPPSTIAQKQRHGDLELSPIDQRRSAADTTTPTAPMAALTPTVTIDPSTLTATALRDRSVPGALRPATEAIMRRDAQSLSLARAAQEMEALNTANFDPHDTNNLAPQPARLAVEPKKTSTTATNQSANSSAKAAANTAATTANATFETPLNAGVNIAADAEKFAERDTVKRLMTQRIAAEADAIQSRRTRTFVVGAAAVLALVAVGGWYVWKETSRFDKPVAGGSLRLGSNAPKPSTVPDAQSAVSAVTSPAMPLPTTTPAPLPTPSIAPPSATNINRTLPPLDANFGQLPRTTVAPPSTANKPAATVIPPMLANMPSSASAPPLNTLAARNRIVSTITVPPASAPTPTPTPSFTARQNIAIKTKAFSNAFNNAAENTEAETEASASVNPPSRTASAKQPSQRLVTTSNRVATPPSAVLLSGYASLLAGDAASALPLYAQAAQATPDNIDAHLGLAVSAAKLNDLSLARRAFARVLELDPRNAQASAGLLLLSGGSNGNTAAAPDAPLPNAANFITQERELKKLLQTAPQSSTLNFSLGNLYAAEKRWTEAQQAFFEAFAAEPNNADYAHNLAVSLDQLSQKKLALQYYEIAVKLKANGRGGQFSNSQIATRIASLLNEAK